MKRITVRITEGFILVISALTSLTLSHWLFWMKEEACTERRLLIESIVNRLFHTYCILAFVGAWD